MIGKLSYKFCFIAVEETVSSE